MGRVSAESKISLSVWLPDYCAPATQNFYKNTLLRDFAKAFPQISVQMVYVDWSVHDQKVATAFAGGTAPDVMQTGAEYVPNLVAKNQIRSIDPLWWPHASSVGQTARHASHASPTHSTTMILNVNIVA